MPFSQQVRPWIVSPQSNAVLEGATCPCVQSHALLLRVRWRRSKARRRSPRPSRLSGRGIQAEPQSRLRQDGSGQNLERRAVQKGFVHGPMLALRLQIRARYQPD